MKKLEVMENDANQTLIKFLEKYLNEAPKSLLQKFLRKKRIKVNGKKQEASYMLQLGDIIDLYLYDEVIDQFQNKDKKHHILNKFNIDIAFENKDVVIMDKPDNMLSHAASKEDYGNNLVDWFTSYLISTKAYNPRLEQSFKPAIVNRLDRNTKGLVIGCKNRNSLVALNELVETDKVSKYYLAIVEGKLEKSKEIVNYLSKDDNNLVKATNSKQGKKSFTYLKPLEYNENYTLVEVKLLTGRSHQIRVTLNDLGLPILGDKKYNRKKSSKKFRNQQLLAYKLEFSEDIEVKSLKGLKVESKFKEEIIKEFYLLGGE